MVAPPHEPLAEWVAHVLGVLETAYRLRAAEHACLARLRLEGVIR